MVDAEFGEGIEDSVHDSGRGGNRPTGRADWPNSMVSSKFDFDSAETTEDGANPIALRDAVLPGE